ncbi:MAG: FAD-dependent oxidoreductase [Rhodospirillaceae bacterium]|jgi:pyruvate/2-oxoglutarate dehydrogenase complex dihydrolipoamide dehydrogenase (E3) component|nr:FAD-dependent oxidoreductase [Rhodospirillaceae bacterium]MBT4588459.1 FAD-dependent oxidoreductase [Rhodospirillaceae bacterium]MBT5939303.1 FAD-dependent oxidoreductase [Rhodospirillaceae bacterium]MBT7265549.1 FAD-dependent oxidoreductase [Rhodospirillaceae bacterium]
MPVERLKTDICIIGAGAGGLVVAAVASQLGIDTILIERDKMGGDCLNYGCVPSKALLAAAHAAETIRSAGRFGLNAGALDIDGHKVFAHVQGAIEAIAPHDSVERFEDYGVKVILGEGKFTGPREVTVGDQVITARRIVVATGSGPFVPPIPGLVETPHFTNETVFEQTDIADHLIVLGGGPIGIELAQAHRQLGAKVTVLEMASILPNDDPAAVAVVRSQLLKEGLDLREGVKVVATEKTEGGVLVTIETTDGKQGISENISGSHLLVAAGRRPHLSGLDLEKAGIDYAPQGIKVDARLRTSNKKVFAIGDVAGGHQFTHIAGYHAGIVIRNILFRLPAKVNLSAYPWVTYTAPELAQVGLTEKAAEAKGLDYRVVNWPLSENDRAITEGNTDGFIKVIATPKGHVLGVTIVGRQAGELIQIWGLAISAKLKIGKIAGMISPYPTLGEANKRAAGEFFKESLFSDKTRKIVKFLSKFG